jgi:uncharacterized membrane protein
MSGTEPLKQRWKWRYFLPVWLVTFATAPSYNIHNMFMTQTPPPGSNLPPPPNIEPFGAGYFLGKVWEQASNGDIGDALIVFGLQLLPFIAFTIVIAAIVYFVFSLFLSTVRRSATKQVNDNTVRVYTQHLLTRWTVPKIGQTMTLEGIVLLGIGGITENLVIMLIAGLLLIPGIIVLFSVWYLKTLRQ